MSNLVNVVKTVLGSKFDVRSFEAKNRVFEFDHQQMNMLEFVRCSKNDVRVQSMFDKMVFDPSLVNDIPEPDRKIYLQFQAFYFDPTQRTLTNGLVIKKTTAMSQPVFALTTVEMPPKCFFKKLFAMRLLWSFPTR